MKVAGTRREIYIVKGDSVSTEGKQPEIICTNFSSRDSSLTNVDVMKDNVEFLRKDLNSVLVITVRIEIYLPRESYPVNMIKRKNKLACS